MTVYVASGGLALTYFGFLFLCYVIGCSLVLSASSRKRQYVHLRSGGLAAYSYQIQIQIQIQLHIQAHIQIQAKVQLQKILKASVRRCTQQFLEAWRLIHSTQVAATGACSPKTIASAS